jgi:small subunit ribosomal protein S20
MASAEKRNRQAQKRRARNVQVRTSVKSAVKRARELVGKGDAATTRSAVDEAVRSLGKAASKGVIHKNAASRRIGRLMKAAAAAK